jgi:Rps23 Pro-64 3,4-dihydroxylase Tpa1-like proline 4-hydroxylase
MISPQNYTELSPLAEYHAASYQQAEPFPHIVLDNFFDSNYLKGLAQDFPNLLSDSHLEQFSSQKEVKSASHLEQGIPDKHLELIRFMNAQPFLSFIQQLTGIKETLISDPYLVGGGLHQIRAGGMLKVHADFNKHRLLGLDRRINVLVYLNEDWHESYGGHLELWDRNMKACQQRILPIFNRLVVFSTTDFSYHGHPDPLTCPEHRTRNSIALYYYSNGRPKSEIDVANVSATTKFVARPESTADRKAFVRLDRGNLIEMAKMCTPPILWKALRSLR